MLAQGREPTVVVGAQTHGSSATLGTLPCALSTRTKRLAARDPGKGRLVRPKSPFKLKEIWAIRIRLQIAERIRDLALLNLAIDSKLRGCDLVHLGDMAHVVASSPAQRTHALRS